MLHRTIVVDVELSSPPTDIEGLDDYTRLMALARLHGAPIGIVHLPVTNGRCTATTIRKAILDRQQWPIINHLLCDLLAAPPRPDGWRISDLPKAPHPAPGGPSPLVSVAVCTRDRPAEMAICLKALDQLDYPHLDILVVDNAPTSDATERLVREAYPHIRYIREPRPGLDWARNRAILEARGEIIAFTDDDAVVDPGWVRAMANLFVENPDVMAVTGLVMPYELETEAQILFELYGGFGRGCEQKWYRLGQSDRKRWEYYGAGQFGTGANMAYRRSLFDQIGYFDRALDVGTVTNGGGDLDMFFRVLVEGHTLVYEPRAIVRHRHRREYAQLRTQMRNHGIGFYSYLVRNALAYPSEQPALIRLGIWWLFWWHARRLLISIIHPTRFPRELILAEIWGSFLGLGRYRKARRSAIQIAEPFGSVMENAVRKKQERPRDVQRTSKKAVGVRTVDLSHAVQSIDDVADYTSVRVYITRSNRPLGAVNIENLHQPISAARLRRAIVSHLHLRILQPDGHCNLESTWTELMAALRRTYVPTPGEARDGASISLPDDVPVSVVLATRDRPGDLRTCLRTLTAQRTPRPVEIVVVDNNPISGLTPPVVAEFPQVTLVSESRQGLSYARNAGIAASKGDIIIAVDDDVQVPPDWLEKLVKPFTRPDVAVVTGNVFPLELETRAQRIFEQYGGLGRGFESREAGGEWFESFRRRAVPTWELGATANAAFRADIFSHPEIGLMDEALGVGTPTGCSEDTYVFYKTLKAGYTIVYEPTAYAWHKHRRSMQALRRQIYGYSKGHVAYQLMTLINDHDLRALLRLGVHLPKFHVKQILRPVKSWLHGKRPDYPLALTLLEIAGNLAGPWALWRSRRRVKRLGRSQPYAPVSERTISHGHEPPQAAAHAASQVAPDSPICVSQP